MVDTLNREKLVNVAKSLFYSRGVQSVGMAELCFSARVSRKLFYSIYSSKDALVIDVIGQWHRDFLEVVTARADAAASPRDSLLSIFEVLSEWFNEDEFRGCGSINAFGELGGVVPGVSELARNNKRGLRDHFADRVRRAGGPEWLGPHLAIVVEGAIVTAAISGTPDSADQALHAATILIDAAISEKAI